jgi:hypothetical protein
MDILEKIQSADYSQMHKIYEYIRTHGLNRDPEIVRACQRREAELRVIECSKYRRSIYGE